MLALYPLVNIKKNRDDVVSKRFENLGNPNDRSISGFRIRHGSSRGPMSIGFYNKLKKLGLGPRETVLCGALRIAPEDERAWDEARANPTDDAELKLIAKARAGWRKRALAAGKAAAESPIHVSKLRLGRSKRPPQPKQRKGQVNG